jgi:hypothetical protein
MATRRTGRSALLTGLIGLLMLSGCDTVLRPGSDVPGQSASPLAGGPPTTVPEPTPRPTIRLPTPTPEPAFATILVRPGDTLTSLALRFTTDPRSIAYWNRARYPSLDPDSPTYAPNRIEAGWVLRVIPGGAVDPEDLPPAAPTAGPSASPAGQPTPPAQPS